MKESTILNYDYIKQVTEIPRLLRWSLSRKKYLGEPRKILVINTCLVGDIAASTFALRQFIQRRPEAKIDLIVSPLMKTVMEKVRGINKVYVAKSVTGRKMEKVNDSERDELLENEYDLVLVIRLSKDANELLKKITAREVRASVKSYTKYLLHLLKHIIHKGNKRYNGKVRQYRQVNFEWFGEEENNQEFSFEDIFDFSNADYEKIKEMEIMKGAQKKIIIHAVTGWQKHWETEKWIKLLQKINKIGTFKFIFVGAGEKEENDFEIIKKGLDFEIFSLINKVDLAQLLLVMRLSDYFIGVDSGPMNMAFLTGLRSVGLLGPGPKHFMPHSQKDVVVDKSICKCTQLFCFKKGICFKDIQVEDVLQGLKKALKN